MCSPMILENTVAGSEYMKKGLGTRGLKSKVESAHLAYFHLIYISHFHVTFHCKTRIPFKNNFKITDLVFSFPNISPGSGK